MKDWIELYQQHGSVRSNGRNAVSEIRQVLKVRAESNRSIFERDIASRLQQHNNRRSGVQEYRFADDDGESLSLRSHPDWDSAGHAKIHFDTARLTILAVVNSDHLQEINLMVRGKIRGTNAPLSIAVHLPDDSVTAQSDGDRQGLGACGHAALHCHIGPSLEAEPKVRVPLPPLRPARALEWMLSQLVPTYEAAPWADVRAALKLPDPGVLTTQRQR